jgi:sec-independent protein translocase protein TatB
MFDIGWDELLLIALVALVVIGPKELPAVLRTLGQWVAKARTLAGEFRSHVDDMIREAGVDDMKNDFQAMTKPIGKEMEDNLMIGNPMTDTPKTADEAAPEARETPPSDTPLSDTGPSEPAKDVERHDAAE